MLKDLNMEGCKLFLRFPYIFVRSFLHKIFEKRKIQITQFRIYTRQNVP